MSDEQRIKLIAEVIATWSTGSLSSLKTLLQIEELLQTEQHEHKRPSKRNSFDELFTAA